MFGIVNAVQGVAIFLAVQVCNNLHFPEYFLPVVALIVGLHFVALAPVLRTSFHLALGTVMCLLAVVTMVVVPKPLWAVVFGLGNGLILWGSAALRLRRVQGALPLATASHFQV